MKRQRTSKLAKGEEEDVDDENGKIERKRVRDVEGGTERLKKKIRKKDQDVDEVVKQEIEEFKVEEDKKEEEEEEEDNDRGKRKKKKLKKPITKGPVKPIDPNLPNNRQFPVKLNLSERTSDTEVIRISAWNVCGIRACDKKGLKLYLESEEPDVIILSETKVQEEPDLIHLKHRFKYRYWGGDPTKGYAGVAILSKVKPIDVIYGLPTAKDQSLTRGRVITLEFDDFYLIGTYTPNAGEKLKFMEKKKEWNVWFEKYLRQLDEKKPIVWGGDINCALTSKDLRNPESNYNKSAGYTQDEIDGLMRQLNPEPDQSDEQKRLIDVWRHLNPDAEGYYTYFSYRFGCREKGIGWRIDSYYIKF
ncbi:Endonuclease/exonuclease/phosphatase [Phakopsora pachyrhizi]|uniref:DNA-(apurinic or apyrimidinic site) endonuclease n=1 Tax=Phakopsora pachyrhizi TaxID=170000 RepID=A0AAV0APY3_PHAPC|nr:Endonuclease/exonuclease/phosphatase [Phakopsora pachyrhizi]